MFQQGQVIVQQTCLGSHSQCSLVAAVQPAKLSLIGSDVVALYPSLTADRTAALVRKKIEESEIKFEGFDYNLGRAYFVVYFDTLTSFYMVTVQG